MSTSINCKELGINCDFVTQMYSDNVTQQEAEEFVIDSFMRHVHTDHPEDWFEIEEIYHAACKAIREKAA